MQEKKAVKNLKIKKVTIFGVIPSFAFQRAKFCALELHRKLPQRFPLPEIVGLLELDWSEKLQEWRQMLGREYWCLRRPVAVFFNDQFIGSDIELIKLTTIGNILMEQIPRKNTSFIKDHFKKDYISYLRKTKRTYCYLDICVDDVYVGTLTFQLYSELLPKTCENFKTLCLGSRGPFLSYRGSRIHRIVKQGWLQGGDIQYKTGGGGFSIFCDPLEDECFGISHNRRGVLSMANAGAHKNGSQFFITLKPSQWMDTHYVAFGQLVEGVKVLKMLESLETFYECPLKKVEIKSCGKLDLGDVEDVDAMYKEEPMPTMKPKKIETISEQLVRMIMEALTDALARKERAPDILDDGDIPSKMNLQLYFQGFYSLPETILEESATYLRRLRRELLRVVKPSATEIVEVIMYDLLMAVLTRMTTLDDVRETIGHDLYQKMVAGIDMEIEYCKKSYVRKLIDQIVSTAQSMVNLITKKVLNMKQTSANLKKFQNQMQEWVRSFVLQETFKGDNYFIAERPVLTPKPEEEKQFPKREGKPCCEAGKKKKEEEMKKKLKQKYAPEDLCCLSSKVHLSLSDVDLYNYFSTCRYDLKKVPKADGERMPLLDLIEISRFKLRFMRKQEDRVKTQDRLSSEKKIRKWMAEVVYTPETSWLKQAVFPKDCRVFDHLEEILYGAMTAAMLEMYYFMEEYLKLCGKKAQFITRTIYPEDSSTPSESPVSVPVPSEVDYVEDKKEEKKEEEEEKRGEEPNLRPCTCGHPCCVCQYAPTLAPPPSLEGESMEMETLSTGAAEPPSNVKGCGSDEILVDLYAFMAEKISVEPEEVDIRSFNWLKPYILEKGCDLKTEFATQVHKWLEGERFNYKGFISKHSLVTRASLLSMSFSLTELIKEENNFKTDIKNFIYDLWDLYFEEMFKEALLEYPPEVREDGEELAGERESEDECKECEKTLEKAPSFDFDKYCGIPCDETDEGKEELGEQDADEKSKESQESSHKEMEEPVTKPEQELEPEPEPEPESKPPKPPKPPTEAELSSPLNDEITSLKSETGDESKEFKEIPIETIMKEDGVGAEPVKKKKSPIVITELVEPGVENRDMPPYVLPFWVKFMTELTKQVLGALAKISRLPRRLYFQTESELNFDDKMKDWFEFNAFNPQPTKGREIMDYIAVHHKSLTNLENSARSYLKKKKYSELLNRCTRFDSADDMAEEIITDVIETALQQTRESETVELFISNLVSSAVTSSPKINDAFSEEEIEDNTFQTDQRESYGSERQED